MSCVAFPQWKNSIQNLLKMVSKFCACDCIIQVWNIYSNCTVNLGEIHFHCHHQVRLANSSVWSGPGNHQHTWSNAESRSDLDIKADHTHLTWTKCDLDDPTWFQPWFRSCQSLWYIVHTQYKFIDLMKYYKSNTRLYKQRLSLQLVKVTIYLE